MNAPQQQSRNLGRASRIFRFLFWVHQVLVGLPSVLIGIDLINIEVRSPGTALILTQGYHALIALSLVWIGGTLLLGLSHPTAPSAVIYEIAQWPFCALHRPTASMSRSISVHFGGSFLFFLDIVGKFTCGM